MSRWERLAATLGPVRLITAMGLLFLGVGAVRALIVWTTGVSLLGAINGFVLTGSPGLALLYGRRWLVRSDVRPDVYPRVAAWCLGGVGAVIVILVLIELEPTGRIDRPFFTPLVWTGIGGVAGFAIGANEAQAVSQTKEAEDHRDQLLAERDLRERIVDTSPVGITVVNADRSTRMVNERAAEIVGRSRAALLELEYDESMLEVANAADDAGEEAVFDRVLGSGDAVYDVERRVTRPDDSRAWLSVSAAPLPDSTGETTAVIFAFEDITDRKELETELQETIDRLRDSNERLEQFAYAASHDLREPLRMVSSYLQLLESRYGDELDEDAREYIDFAVDGADRMRAMIDSLLEYSRITSRGGSLVPTDADDTLDDVLTDLRPRIEETDATVTADELPTVTADPDQLAQVFRNLVSNALSYSGDEPPRVHVSAERTDGGWRFAVADEGIGIDPDQRDHIFEVFETAHTAAEGSGSGIGLALCERIVERHGGEIWVESEPGEGATFFFTVPAAVDRRAAADTRSSPRDERARSGEE